MSSLPHRQLRKVGGSLIDILTSSLPHRQLRNVIALRFIDRLSSLPHRQLRNVDLFNRGADSVFTAAQAA